MTNRRPPLGGSDVPSSWAPIDLAPILAGRAVVTQPTMLYRSDGACLLYDGKDHAIYGEPESCKGWLALRAPSPHSSRASTSPISTTRTTPIPR
jgi:hypothetical protein